MPEYSRSTTIDANPDDLFEFLSKVENLPQYFTGLKDARHREGDEVHVTANPDATGGAPGQGEVEADAWFHIDADRRALSWGSEGERDYHGELQVTSEGDGAQVSVTLHTEHDDRGPIEDGIDETLANIARIAAERPQQLG